MRWWLAWIVWSWAGDGQSSDEVRRAPEAMYPSKLVYDRTVSYTCSARVILGEKGRPDEVEIFDCPEVLKRRAARQVRRYRWMKDLPSGSEREVEITFASPIDDLTYAAPNYWRFTEGEPCALWLVVSAAGEMSIRDGVAGCMPSGELHMTVPERPLRHHAPAICPVTLTVRDGTATQVDVYRCAPALREPLRQLLMGWSWPEQAEVTPYSILIQVDGDPARRRL